MNNPQFWQAIAAVIAAYAALLGGLYAIVTRPMMARMDGMQDSMQAQIADIIRRLERIETKLDDHSQRITRLEERTSPLHR
jgi:F0F1-type ATP synthase membrane subunit b/b'